MVLCLRTRIGRTTFVNTLCSKAVLEHKEADEAGEAHVEEGVKIKPITVGKSALDIQSYLSLGSLMPTNGLTRTGARRGRHTNLTDYRRHTWFRRPNR